MDPTGESPQVVSIDASKAHDLKFRGRNVDWSSFLGVNGGLVKEPGRRTGFIRLFHVAGSSEEQPLNVHLSIVRQSEIGGSLSSWVGISSLGVFNPWVPLLDFDPSKPLPVSVSLSTDTSQPIARKNYQLYFQISFSAPK